MKSNSSLLDGISVIICCYNSDWIIARCLDALKAQIIPIDLLWEVVLVDNNCSDATVQIAKETMLDSGVDFSIVSEPEPGLMNARKRGISAVKYKYCIYCDDDNLLSSDYVTYMHNFLAFNSDVGAAGGKGIPEFECEPEIHFSNYAKGYAVGSQKTHPDYLFGAGLALRTDVVRTIYDNFNIMLIGRNGSKLLSGDDLELVNYIRLMGYRLYPTDDVQYIHVLKTNRLTEEYRVRMYDGLMLALPIGDMMNLAINNEPIFNYIISYLKSELTLILYGFMFWSKKDISRMKRFVDTVRFWGIFKLVSVYINCLKVKNQYRYIKR